MKKKLLERSKESRVFGAVSGQISAKNPPQAD